MCEGCLSKCIFNVQKKNRKLEGYRNSKLPLNFECRTYASKNEPRLHERLEALVSLLEIIKNLKGRHIDSLDEAETPMRTIREGDEEQIYTVGVAICSLENLDPHVLH